jgi:hypothetical protein
MNKEKYSKTSDFSDNFNSVQFHEEIGADGTIGSIFDGIHCVGDSIYCLFTQALTAGEKTILDGLVAAHVPSAPDQESGSGNLGLIEFAQAKFESTTSSSSSWRAKVTFPFYADAGKYRLEWSYLWKYSSVARSFKARITLDGTEIWRQEQEPKDTQDYYPACGKIYETLTDGNHTVVLEFQTSKNGETATMSHAVVEIAKFRE